MIWIEPKYCINLNFGPLKGKRWENLTNYRTLFAQHGVLCISLSGSSWSLLRQYFEAGISEVEEELGEKEGSVI